MTKRPDSEHGMSTRELRLAITKKLKHRRDLMELNSRLRHERDRLEDRNRFLTSALGNPLVDVVLEDCADEIIKVIFEHAIKASEAVAERTQDNGDYVIGINIAPLQIRRRLFRDDFDLAEKIRPNTRVQFVDIKVK